MGTSAKESDAGHPVAESSMESPGSSSFSTQPVAPVVASSHHRRQGASTAEPTRSKPLRTDQERERTMSAGIQGSTNGRSSAPNRAGLQSNSPSTVRNSGRIGPSESTGRRQERGQQLATNQATDSASETASEGEEEQRNQRRSRQSLPSLASFDQRRQELRGSGGDLVDSVNEENGQPRQGSRRVRSPSHERDGDLPERDAWGKRQRLTGERDSDSTRLRENDSPAADDHDIKIMFHGKEVYADDLIGLRVAKTFAGHGRFLGQVVKFDDASQMYTIVYADGDAEELSIENTIQILIQHEIERADYSAQSLSSTLRKERSMSSSTSPPTPAAVVPLAAPVPAPSSSLNGSGAASSRLEKMSSLEVQFMVGLFENHAVPELMRLGWTVEGLDGQSRQRRYIAPLRDGARSPVCFSSPLEVIELIASDKAMLDRCFPRNIQHAITSVFRDEPSSEQATETVSNPTAARHLEDETASLEVPPIGVASTRRTSDARAYEHEYRDREVHADDRGLAPDRSSRYADARLYERESTEPNPNGRFYNDARVRMMSSNAPRRAFNHSGADDMDAVRVGYSSSSEWSARESMMNRSGRMESTPSTSIERYPSRYRRFGSTPENESPASYEERYPSNRPDLRSSMADTPAGFRALGRFTGSSSSTRSDEFERGPRRAGYGAYEDPRAGSYRLSSFPAQVRDPSRWPTGRTAPLVNDRNSPDLYSGRLRTNHTHVFSREPQSSTYADDIPRPS